MSRNTFTCVVKFTHSSGVDLNAHLILNDKPTRYTQKLKTLTNYVKHYPSGWKKRLELAELLYSLGNWQQAVEEYRQVLQRQPQLMEVQLHLGKILSLMGRNPEAIAVYQSALRLSCNVATQHHLNGLIAICQDLPQQALRLFESAVSIEPDNPSHWHPLAQLHLETQSFDAALRAFDTILSLNPNDVLALNHSYEPLLATGQFQEAQRRLELALKLSTNCHTLQKLAAHRCHQGLVSGEAGKQTKRLIRDALDLAPDSANVHQVLSLHHSCRGEWEKGVVVLQKFTEQHPNNPSGWYHYAQCLFQTGNSETAAEAILKAHRLYQSDRKIYQALCEILPSAQRLEELELTSPTSLLKQMLERFPQYWSVWVSVGRVLVENFQDIEQGCMIAATGSQLEPQLAHAWFRYGRVLALAGRHQKAIAALEKGWQRLIDSRQAFGLSHQGGDLQSVSASVWLGESYQALGEEASSRRWLQEALHYTKVLMEFNPTTACYWQGRVLLGLGDVTDAVQVYCDALARHLPYPARQEVQDALQMYHAVR